MPPDAVHSVNPTFINEHMNTMRKGEKTMKKMLALLIAMTMMLTMGSAMAEGIKLTVCMPLGQWTDNFNVLIDSYMAEHPEIESIDATFPSSDVYNDLLKADLASGELPDIISICYGRLNEEWFQYCADLSTDFPAYADLTEAQIKVGSADGHGFIVAPIYEEGTGILYNMRLLQKAGWDHTPQTRDELAKLCEDLTAAGIKPFMHQWGETYLNLFNWVGPTWLGNKEGQGREFLEEMLSGKDMDLANDKEWNDFLDTYEILIQYAQEGAIATDKWTCRNAFFLEECAMLVGEGSWETPNIANTNPELLNFAKQDVLPVSNDPAANNLQLQTIGISVTNTANLERIKAAKEFASYIIDSPEAAKWHQELMGSPTSVITLEVSDQLPALGKDVIALMQEGRAAESMYQFMPAVIRTDLEEAWARYVAQSFSREQFTKRYEQIFKDYADGFYD